MSKQSLLENSLEQMSNFRQICVLKSFHLVSLPKLSKSHEHIYSIHIVWSQTYRAVVVHSVKLLREEESIRVSEKEAGKGC